MLNLQLRKLSTLHIERDNKFQFNEVISHFAINMPYTGVY